MINISQPWLQLYVRNGSNKHIFSIQGNNFFLFPNYFRIPREFPATLCCCLVKDRLLRYFFHIFPARWTLVSILLTDSFGSVVLVCLMENRPAGTVNSMWKSYFYKNGQDWADRARQYKAESYPLLIVASLELERCGHGPYFIHVKSG